MRAGSAWPSAAPSQRALPTIQPIATTTKIASSLKNTGEDMPASIREPIGAARSGKLRRPATADLRSLDPNHPWPARPRHAMAARRRRFRAGRAGAAGTGPACQPAEPLVAGTDPLPAVSDVAGAGARGAGRLVRARASLGAREPGHAGAGRDRRDGAGVESPRAGRTPVPADDLQHQGSQRIAAPRRSRGARRGRSRATTPTS